MKKARLIALCVVLIGVIAFGILNRNAVHTVNALPIATPDWNAIANGDYEGAYSCGPVSVRVRATVHEHRLEMVELLRHDNGLGSAAERILTDVIEAQSLEVDSVAGATVSSRCILRAVQLALEEKP